MAAQSDAVRIGVLTDMSGGMAASSGLGSVEAAQLAVEDLGSNVNGKPIVVINADFQNRGDLAQHISESWLSKQGVDVVVDVPNGPIAAKLQDYFKEQKKILLTSSPSSTRFRDASCHNNSLSWLYDRDTLTVNLIQALVDDKKKRWFVIKSEDGYSCDLAKIAKRRIKDSGAELVGEAQFGKRMSGLSIILEQAEDVKADVIFLAFDRPDVLHLLNHWPVHGKDKDIPPVAFTTLSLSDIHELGSKPAPTFYTVSPFYWNQDGTTREWSTKFATRNRGAMPTDIQASVYSSVRHYLESLKIAQNGDAQDILGRMKGAALADPLFGASHIRNDGLVAHRLLLLSSIRNEDRGHPWDVYKIVKTINPQNVALPAEIICNKE
ncbi:MAG: ABC transporter substrate-binding protein [Alphaproteobacteria bacterium]|nr:ABC transporter substrate-binding protein [Alphaproteobacteria bacterium]